MSQNAAALILIALYVVIGAANIWAKITYPKRIDWSHIP